MNEWAVEFAGVYKRYPHFALEDINLRLATGGVMGFIGANGAGKSTAMRILMGLVHQDRGEVRVLGSVMPTEQIQAKMDIGYVSEDLRLYSTASLDWHMRFIASIYPAFDQQYARRLLQRFDLKAAQKIKGMSHGQRVKAALLLVLARRPSLLVLDEPTTGLDPVARQEVLGALMEVLADEHRSILFSSHNTLDVEQISDQIVFIDRGRIIDADDKEQFLDRWRRVRLELPAETPIPALNGLIAANRSGHSTVLTLSQFEPAQITYCQQAGASVIAVETMTLEEIFLANVQARRAGENA